MVPLRQPGIPASSSLTTLKVTPGVETLFW